MRGTQDIGKVTAKLGGAVKEEMDAMDEATLKTAVVQAESGIAQAKRERDENPKYQEAKENCNALSQGLKDVKKFQGARIEYALYRLEELGSASISVSSPKVAEPEDE